MRYAWKVTLPKERRDVRTLLVVCVRYEARSGVRMLLAFIWSQRKRKGSEVDSKLILTFGMVPREGLYFRWSCHLQYNTDHNCWLSPDLTLIIFSHSDHSFYTGSMQIYFGGAIGKQNIKLPCDEEMSDTRKPQSCNWRHFAIEPRGILDVNVRKSLFKARKKSYLLSE